VPRNASAGPGGCQPAEPALGHGRAPAARRRVADLRLDRPRPVRTRVRLVAGVGLSGRKVTTALEPIVQYRGAPQSIRVDNRSEFPSRALEVGGYQRGVQSDFIRPGRPVETITSRPSMADAATSARTWTASFRWLMPGGSWSAGGKTTIKTACIRRRPIANPRRSRTRGLPARLGCQTPCVLTLTI
jgi:hypothetical protein